MDSILNRMVLICQMDWKMVSSSRKIQQSQKRRKRKRKGQNEKRSRSVEWASVVSWSHDISKVLGYETVLYVCVHEWDTLN